MYCHSALRVAVFATGSAAHESHAEVKRIQRRLPLAGFDFILRKYGAVLWVLPLVLRAASHLYRPYHIRWQWAHFGVVVVVYSVAAILRATIYVLHARGRLLLCAA